MGTVYRATQLANGQVVALKLVPHLHSSSSDGSNSPEVQYRLALAREFQTLASLHHPNVIRVLNYGFDEEHGPYYIMELLEAPRTPIEATAGQSEESCIRLIAQLLRALAYIHQRGVIHRDIKPSNVATERDWTSNDPQRREVLANHRLRCGSVFGSLGGLLLEIDLVPGPHFKRGRVIGCSSAK
jgi:serine/threonine protein kinase